MTKKIQMDAEFNPTLTQVIQIFRHKLKMAAFPMGTKVITKVIIAIKVTPQIKELKSGQPWCVGKTPEAEVLTLPSQLM